TGWCSAPASGLPAASPSRPTTVALSISYKKKPGKAGSPGGREKGVTTRVPKQKFNRSKPRQTSVARLARILCRNRGRIGMCVQQYLQPFSGNHRRKFRLAPLLKRFVHDGTTGKRNFWDLTFHGGVHDRDRRGKGWRTELLALFGRARERRGIILKSRKILDELDVSLRVDARAECPIQGVLIADIDVLIDQIDKLLPQIKFCQCAPDLRTL